MPESAWQKLGCIYLPQAKYPWMQSHAANPVAEKLGEGRIRVYFGCRGEENRTSIASFVISVGRPRDINELSESPILSPGAPGRFDDSGVSMGCLSYHEGKTFLYYLGWNLGVTVPWRNSIGLATAEAGTAHFEKAFHAPVMDRSHEDPFTISYPWIVQEEGVWKMWYGSNLSWGRSERDMDHYLKYAESDDGIHWRRDGKVILEPADESEYAFAKPCVLKIGGVYHLWFSYRGDRYLIGYARSIDGKQWERGDANLGLDVSNEGWDSESVEYSCVFVENDSLFMLYNGNDYGRTGIGLARAPLSRFSG